MNSPKGKEEEEPPHRKVPRTVDIAPTVMADEVFGPDKKRSGAFAVPTATRHLYKPQDVAVEMKPQVPFPPWLQLAFALGFGLLGYLAVKFLLKK